jgi:signal transduction histidine kinase
MATEQTDIQDSSASLESVIWRRLMAYWRAMGLTGQFLFLTVTLFLFLSWLSGLVQERLVARGMLKDALRLETKLLHAAVGPLLPQTQVRDRFDPETETAIHAAIARHLDSSVVSKVKLWAMTGELIFDSTGASTAGIARSEPDSLVMRAARGETVTEKADPASLENGFDHGFGNAVYEVYGPLHNNEGEIVAVGELYASTERYTNQVSGLIDDMGNVRLLAALIGVAGLLVLVQMANLRLRAQEAALRASWKAAEDLVRRNRALLAESESLRHANIARNEQLLTRVGYDLHDGPVQLLGLAAMYLSTVDRLTETPALERTQHLLSASVADLRRISTGLILPELDRLTLAETVQTAIDQFSHVAGVHVERRIDPLNPPWPDAARATFYRILLECLQNGLRHAGGKGLEVALTQRASQIVLMVADRGPGLDAGDSGQTRSGRARIGLRGIRDRLSDMGGTIEIETRRSGGTRVTVVVPVAFTKNSDNDPKTP